MSMDKYEEIKCFDASECEYKKCPLYNFETNKCKIESLKEKRVPVGDQPQRQEETTFIVGKTVNVEGTLIGDPSYKAGDRADGTKWKWTKFDLQIDNDVMPITLWDTLAEEGIKHSSADKLLLKAMRVNEYKGTIGLGSTKDTEVTKLN